VGFHGVSPEFDGRKWRDAMFLGMSPANAGIDENVESYVDTTDLFMLTLNIRACFAIMSKMERMVHHFEKNEVDDHGSVDIVLYRRAWML
jgi:hypothetical protein